MLTKEQSGLIRALVTHVCSIRCNRAACLLMLVFLLAGCIGGTHCPVSTPMAVGETYDTFVAANGIMFGFDAAHTHFNPYEHLLTPANVSRLVQAWAYPAVGVIGASPVVANGIVCIGSWDDSLYTLEVRTGKQLWSFATGGAIRSSPAVANGIVYVGSDDHSLYALDARTGSKLWRFTTGDTIRSSPAVANGIVYVGTWSLYALDARLGKHLWSFVPVHSIASSPAVAAGIVYVGLDDGSLYALG